MAVNQFFSPSSLEGFLSLILTFLLVFFLIMIGLYIYNSLAFMAIGKKAKLNHPGLAWIPGIGPLIIAFQASKMHWWPWLLLGGFLTFSIPILGQVIFLISAFLFIIFTIIWDWKMFQAINKPGWWALMLLIPIVNFIFLGIAAWSKEQSQT